MILEELSMKRGMVRLCVCMALLLVFVLPVTAFATTVTGSFTPAKGDTSHDQAVNYSAYALDLNGTGISDYKDAAKKVKSGKVDVTELIGSTYIYDDSFSPDRFEPSIGKYGFTLNSSSDYVPTTSTIAVVYYGNNGIQINFLNTKASASPKFILGGGDLGESGWFTVGETPATGDTNYPVLYGLLLLLGAGVLVWMAKKRIAER